MSAAEIQPLFLGGHAAIDFINTSFAPDGQQIDCIRDGRSLLSWMVGAELLSKLDAQVLPRRLGVSALDDASAEVRRMRAWSRDWIDRWSTHPKREYSAEIAQLNQKLSRCAFYSQVEAQSSGFIVAQRMRFESTDTLIGLIAFEIARLIANEDPSLIKTCAGAGCTLWFLDRTKAHRRIFCSAAVCGNRAKVAAFRERQRQS